MSQGFCWRNHQIALKLAPLRQARLPPAVKKETAAVPSKNSETGDSKTSIDSRREAQKDTSAKETVVKMDTDEAGNASEATPSNSTDTALDKTGAHSAQGAKDMEVEETQKSEKEAAKVTEEPSAGEDAEVKKKPNEDEATKTPQAEGKGQPEVCKSGPFPRELFFPVVTCIRCPCMCCSLGLQKKDDDEEKDEAKQDANGEDDDEDTGEDEDKDSATRSSKRKASESSPKDDEEPKSKRVSL